MLRRPSRQERARIYQRDYAARARAGIGLYPVPLTAQEVDALVDLGWLKEGDEIDRKRVGLAAAAAIKDLAQHMPRMRHQPQRARG